MRIKYNNATELTSIDLISEPFEGKHILVTMNTVHTSVRDIWHKQLSLSPVILYVLCNHDDRGKFGHGFKRPDDTDHIEIIDIQILLDQRSAVRERTNFIMICFNHIIPPLRNL